ncbi:MAG: hypothetical protein QQN41_08375, partial [Nitrosopumilus sp.]
LLLSTVMTMPFSKIICIFHRLLLLLNTDLFDPTTGQSRPINQKSFLSELFKSLALLIKRHHGFNFRLEYSWLPTPWGQYILWPKEP